MPAGNLDKVIKDLAAQIATLSDAIQGTAGDAQGRDFSKKIADRMQEQYNVIQERAKVAGQNLDIEKELQDTLGKILDEEKKSFTLAEKLETVYKEAVKKGMKGLDLYEKLNKEWAKVTKDVNLYSKVIHMTVEKALKLSKEDLASMLRKLDSFGFIGKIGKVIATTMVGKEGSQRRLGVERGMAVKMHPDLFGGEQAKGLGALLGNFSKFAVFAGIIVTILKALFDNLMKISGISADLVKNTGFTANNVEELSKQMIYAQAGAKEFGVELEDMQNAAGALALEFKNAQQTNINAVQTLSYMSKISGVAANQLARVYRIMAVNWRMSDVSIRSFSVQLRDQANVYGLSFGNIMQDITANAENLTMYFHGSVEELKQAAVRAAMLQTSLSTQVGITQKFSHWADAIQNSFMLSAIAGKSFNAASLYTKAALGDTKGVVDEITAGLESSASDWQKIVPMAQQVSQTLGVPFEEIKNMMENKTIEKMLRGLGIGASQMGYAVKAVREISTAKGSTAFEVAKGLKNNMGELNQSMLKSMQLDKEKITAFDEKALKQAEMFAAKLGLKETMSPQQQILASIASMLEKIMIGFTNVVLPAMQPLANLVNLVTGGISGATTLSSYENAMTPSRHGLQFQHKALGGIVSSPSIAGEAGPEAVLPLTGQGKKSFTEPFLANTMTPLINEIKEAIANLTRIPIQVKVYLDSETVSEKLDKYAYIQSTR